MPTKIERADEVWNPVTGCSPVSKGCENFRVTLHEDRLYEPLKKIIAEAGGIRGIR